MLVTNKQKKTQQKTEKHKKKIKIILNLMPKVN